MNRFEKGKIIKMENSKRKRENETDIPEERLLKKFEVLESRLMQLWETDSNRESIESINATGSGSCFSFLESLFMDYNNGSLAETDLFYSKRCVYISMGGFFFW